MMKCNKIETWKQAITHSPLCGGLGVFLTLLLLTSCLGSKMSSSSGGEVTGASGRTFTEPTPHGMTLIKRGH